MIRITSNGSKWAGERPDPLPVLLRVLENYAADPRRSGSERSILDAVQHFRGNFLTLSHVFDITTDEPAIIAQIRPLLAKSLKRGRRMLASNFTEDGLQ